ncbi:helix-turn-helix domain-containing protein [Streptomyces griseoincarnatus]
MSFNPKPLRLAAATRHEDYSVPAIARRLSLPPATVYRWTSGRGVPSGESLAVIERTYGVTAADLFPADA